MTRTFQEDFSRIIDLIQICLSEEIEKGMEVPSNSYFQELLKQENIFLLIHEEENNIVGFVLLEGEIRGFPSSIMMIGVEPLYRRKKIGSTLLRAVIDLAREKNWTKIKILVRPNNFPLRCLITQLGFIPEGLLRKELFKEDIITYAYFPL
ncbi:GNAT family N-acetyltransferase [Candidatus Hodarchaeum mangrovi]